MCVWYVSTITTYTPRIYFTAAAASSPATYPVGEEEEGERNTV